MSENGQELKQIELPVSITVRDLAQTLDASPIEIIKTLMANGMMANINQEMLVAEPPQEETPPCRPAHRGVRYLSRLCAKR